MIGYISDDGKDIMDEGKDGANLVRIVLLVILAAVVAVGVGLWRVFH